MTQVRTRIAPSPTGMPHIGTMFQALLDYVYARKHKGSFVVRIEDTDRNRLVEDSEEAIFQALKWIGLSPDESPRHPGKYGPYRQSERLEIYQKYANQLLDQGHAYYCFCSPERLDQVRKSMQKEGKPPMYDQHCRDLNPAESAKRSKSEPFVIRMKIPANDTLSFTDEIRGEISFQSSTVDDQVILKSDGFPTYHLAVVVDDRLMEITHVVRGEEWITSTPKHLLLYRYFDWDMPAIIHTPLLRNQDRSKLGKRHGHASVSWYQEQGFLKEAVINFLASRVWNHPKGEEIYDLEELIKHFEFSDMHIQGPIVDLDKLTWINSQWLRRLPEAEVLNRLKPFIPKNLNPGLFEKIWPHIKDRLETFSQIESLTQYFYQTPQVEPKLILKQMKADEKTTAAYLDQVQQNLNQINTWTAAILEESLRDLQLKLDLKPRAAFMTIRVVITGQTATPPLFDVMEILGKEEVLTRLTQAKSSLQVS